MSDSANISSNKSGCQVMDELWKSMSTSYITHPSLYTNHMQFWNVAKEKCMKEIFDSQKHHIRFFLRKK